jgi:hypothetical protein
LPASTGAASLQGAAPFGVGRGRALRRHAFTFGSRAGIAIGSKEGRDFPPVKSLDHDMLSAELFLLAVAIRFRFSSGACNGSRLFERCRRVSSEWASDPRIFTRQRLPDEVLLGKKSKISDNGAKIAAGFIV